MSSSIDDLIVLLNELKPPLQISSVDGGRSVIHDITYRLSVIFLVFAYLGKESGNDRVVNGTVLWFSQFIVARPDLLPSFTQWALNERKKTAVGSLFGWPLMPKGYLNDNEHIRLLSVLIATKDVDVRDSNSVTLKNTNNSSLSDLKTYVMQAEVFKREKMTLQTLKDIDVTLKLLGAG